MDDFSRAAHRSNSGHTSRRAWLLAAGGAALMPFGTLALAQSAPVASKNVANAADGGAKAALQPYVGVEPPAATRLISLSGALTEIVYQLGGEALLVGSDTTSNYPEAANPKCPTSPAVSTCGAPSATPAFLATKNRAACA